MRTIDIKFFELCDEIDYWKARAAEAEKEVEYWRSECHKIRQTSMDRTNRDIANMLTLALNITDDEDGNLVIPKENREKMVEQIKT